MKFRILSLTCIALSLAACTTSDPINATWRGKSAGKFFAAYGPPAADIGSSGYRWKGGYARVNGRLRSCSANIMVNGKYEISRIAITGDAPGATGKSFCQEVLAPNAAAKK